MRKKQEKKQSKKQSKPSLYHSVDRVFLWAIPTALAFLLLVLFGQLSPLAAVIAFLLTILFMFWLAAPFLKELEVLMNYLKSEAEGQVSLRIPKFAKRRREAFKIVQSFHQIKMGWLQKNKILEAQTLSDTAILEMLPEPLLMLNSSGDIVGANLSARQILGGGIIFKNIAQNYGKIFVQNADQISLDKMPRVWYNGKFAAQRTLRGATILPHRRPHVNSKIKQNFRQVFVQPAFALGYTTRSATKSAIISLLALIVEPSVQPFLTCSLSSTST